MATSRLLKAASVAAHAGYHAIGYHIIRRVSVMATTAAAWAGLTWSGVHVMAVGWILGGVGCHITSKGAELICDIDYVISFWSWILLWKYPYFVEISTFHGYYPHFMYISVFCGDFRISWKYPNSVYIIRISSFLSLTFYSSNERDLCNQNYWRRK